MTENKSQATFIMEESLSDQFKLLGLREKRRLTLASQEQADILRSNLVSKIATYKTQNIVEILRCLNPEQFSFTLSHIKQLERVSYKVWCPTHCIPYNFPSDSEMDSIMGGPKNTRLDMDEPFLSLYKYIYGIEMLKRFYVHCAGPHVDDRSPALLLAEASADDIVAKVAKYFNDDSDDIVIDIENTNTIKNNPLD